VDIAEHLKYLAVEATKLGEAAASTTITAAVPGCPDWTVRDLVGHVGMVHRWATNIVTNGLESPDGETADAPPDPELLDWYAEGHRVLLETLTSAPPDLSCFAFLPAPSPLAFWARRQLHETTIHRADAATAAGIPVVIDDAIGLDGIEEMLLGFAKRRREFVPGSVRLDPAGGPGWLLRLTAEGAAATPADDTTSADATVSGDAGQVYLWLWNRPADVTITGDQTVADRWHKVKVRWG
jgi:uncharacterized protein (TIGR03083 family)